MTKGLLLDLDDTLLDDKVALRHALHAFIRAHESALPNRPLDDLVLLWRSILSTHWSRHVSGKLSFRAQRRERVREFLNRKMTDDEADLAFHPYLDAYEAAWALNPGVTEFLDCTTHIRKVIVTNGDREQQIRKIELTGLSSHIVGVVTPSDCGSWKPGHGIFHSALKMLNCEAQDCLMVGDDPEMDIEPAERLGMRTFLVTTPEKDWQRVTALL